MSRRLTILIQFLHVVERLCMLVKDIWLTVVRPWQMRPANSEVLERQP